MNKKQIIIIGGGEAWDTYEEYIEYLKNYEFTQDKLEKAITRRWKENMADKLGEDFQVIRPSMPCSRNAKYDEWAIWFEKIIPFMQNEVILIGHSLGANFLAKYLAENTLTISIKQLHLVAGCYGSKGGFMLPDSLENVSEQCDNIYIYHSTDDPVVDFSDAQKYIEALPEAELVKFDDRNHFLQEEFPEIVDNIRK